MTWIVCAKNLKSDTSESVTERCNGTLKIQLILNSYNYQMHNHQSQSHLMVSQYLKMKNVQKLEINFSDYHAKKRQKINIDSLENFLKITMK